MTFLTAKWENLILINYVINPEILKPYVPFGTEIDLFNNTCYVSLVGFMFNNTTVLGMKLPFHINFEEVNLRFYVKHNENRGVVFIKEIVPKPIITSIANSIYKEHYQTCKMSHKWDFNKDSNYIEYSWKLDNLWQQLNVTTDVNPIQIEPNSEEEFITEHYYGYTKHKNKTFEYEVEHPRWEHFSIKNFNTNVDFKLNYGNDFSFLNSSKPKSIILAKGSKIKVKNKTSIQKY